MWPFRSKSRVQRGDRYQSWPPIAPFEILSKEGETQQVRDHKLLLQRRVSEAAHLFVSNEHKPGAELQFRRKELSPEWPSKPPLTLADTRSIRAALVDSVCRKRSAIIPDAPPVNQFQGRFLVFEVDHTLNDGTAEEVSNGFFDAADEPAWETWIDYYDDREIGGRLLCYIPAPLLSLAKAGVSANPTECIHWIDVGEIVTDRVLAQRIRNRIVEYLELASSFEKQREYEVNVPIAHVPGEVICQWGDWVDEERLERFGAPVYSRAETEAMRKFHAIWDAVAERMPGGCPRLAEVQRLPEWEQLRTAAKEALKVFSVRGKLPEDEEMPDGGV